MRVFRKVLHNRLFHYAEKQQRRAPPPNSLNRSAVRLSRGGILVPWKWKEKGLLLTQTFAGTFWVICYSVIWS